MEYPFKDLLPLDEVLEREGYYKDWTHLDPEVFYSLTQISQYIKTKGFGVDVRLLIAQLAEHFGLKTTQVVDLANLLQQKFENLEGVTQSFTNNINSLVAQMEADKDAVIANATVDSEVILARGGKATLGQRLDETTAQLAETVTFSNQTHFVDVLKNMQSFNTMTFQNESSNKYSLMLESGEKYIKYQFVKDINDDFIKLNHGKIGSINIATNAVPPDNTTGSWNRASSNQYAVDVGGTFSAVVEGSSIDFFYYSDDRGGIWEFIVDGNEGNPINISTFSRVARRKFSTIIDGLADEEHHVLATFKGADPKHPPRGGVPRGWAYVVSPGNPLNTLIGYGDKQYTEEGEALAEASNKEMAFRVSQGGTTYWIPDHGTGTAFNASPPKFILDGTSFDVSQLGSSDSLECEYFELIQDIYGKTPDTGNFLRIRLTSKIDKSGVVDFFGTMEVLEPFWITAGYPAMMPTSALFDEFVTGIGNVKVNNGDNSEDMYPEEKNLVYSVAAISSANKNLFSAIQVEAPAKTLRQGKEGTPNEGGSLYLWKRESAPKIYFRAFTGHDVEVGEDYSWRARFLIGKIKDVYGFVKS